MVSSTISSTTPHSSQQQGEIRPYKVSRQRLVLDILLNFCLKTLCWHSFSVLSCLLTEFQSECKFCISFFKSKIKQRILNFLVCFVYIKYFHLFCFRGLRMNLWPTFFPLPHGSCQLQQAVGRQDLDPHEVFLYPLKSWDYTKDLTEEPDLPGKQKCKPSTYTLVGQNF